MEDKKIVFCLPGIYYTGNFLKNFALIMAELSKEKSVYMVNEYSPNIYHSRNLTLSAWGDDTAQLPLNGMEYDRIVFIDSDIAFTPEDVKALLRHDLPFVSGIYRMKNRKFAVSPEPIKEGMYRAEWCGFGFCALKKGVLEAIGYPWFRPTVEDGIIYGDDRAFCKNMQERNIDINIDPSIHVKHEKLALI